MIRKVISFWFALLVIFLCTTDSYTWEKFPPEGDRKGEPGKDERYEGIRQFENVSSAPLKLELKSALVKYLEEKPKDPKYFSIGFYVDRLLASKNMDILIENKEGKPYYMIPVKRQWSNGLQEFKWDCDFARKEDIRLYNLYAKAQIRKPGLVNTIFPIALYYNKGPNQVKEYEFAFTSSQQVTLKYAFYDESGEEKYSDLLRKMPRNREIKFTWDCGDIPTGKYQLFIEYTFTSADGHVVSSDAADGRDVPLSDTYEFYHRKDWSIKE